ncbi:MAG TPA: ThuA domain-containing protein [Pirellulales bacterium]|nr:ThuA domain-containing protein [Pirellulales bacterium]
MKRREMLLATGLTALGLSQFTWGRAAAADKPKRKLLMFTKSAGFEHSVAKRDGDKLSHNERIMTDLSRDHGFEVVCTKDGTVFDSDLDQYDAFLFYTTGVLTEPGTDKTPPMSAKGKERLLAAVASGKGFLASHCGSDTFHSPGHRAGKSREEQDEKDSYIAMLGGEFISHGPQQKARQRIIDAKFPGFGDIDPKSIVDGEFMVEDEWYSLKNFPDDLHVILAMDTQGMKGKDYERPPYPSTWARRHEKGRVFYTSMGHREDVWTNPNFQRMLLGGLAWAFGDVQYDVPANIKEATPGAHVMPPA